jgi:hypothetical protein
MPDTNRERVRRRRDAIAATLRETGLLGVTRRTQTRYLLTGILTCAECGANFIVRAVENTRFGKYRYYGCAYHSRRGDTVCANRTLLPQAAIEAELLELLHQQLLTPAVLARVLATANARLRAQAAARPRVKELRRDLKRMEGEIANYRRAVARGDFRSLETALGPAEQRHVALQAELARLDGNQQQAVVQLTPGSVHAVNLLDQLVIEAGAVYIFDRASLDFARLYRLQQRKGFFVTRAKRNFRFRYLESQPVYPTTGVHSDQVIRLYGFSSQQRYPERLHRSRHFDAAHRRWLVFLTTNFTLPALPIAPLYPCRWQVEGFFKWLTQHLRIQAFYGKSEHAIKTRLWVALAVDVLVAIVQKRRCLEASL